MIHQDAIEQAVERQLEIERKAAAWDTLLEEAEARSNPIGHLTATDLIDLMHLLLERPRHG